MNKKELVAFVADKAGISAAAAERSVTAFTEAVSTALAAGENLALVGFGTFEARTAQAREGVNPFNGQPMHIPAKTSVKFKASKKLNEKL